MQSEPDADNRQNGESIAFRVPASLKTELNRLATRNHQSLAELMRSLARERLSLERPRAYQVEAQRQSRETAAAAENPTSDEYAVMRELEADLDELDKE